MWLDSIFSATRTEMGGGWHYTLVRRMTLRSAQQLTNGLMRQSNLGRLISMRELCPCKLTEIA